MLTLRLQATKMISWCDEHVCEHYTTVPATNEHRAQVLTSVNIK